MKLIGKEKDYYDELVSMFDVDELKPKEKELINIRLNFILNWRWQSKI